MLKVGKLYRCPSLHLLLFPTLNAAEEPRIKILGYCGSDSPAFGIRDGEDISGWIGLLADNGLTCKSITKNDIFMVVDSISRQNKLVKVLHGENLGWVFIGSSENFL